MRITATILVSFIILSFAPAFSRGGDLVIPSPGKRYFAVFTGYSSAANWFESLSIRDARQNVLYSSNGTGLTEQMSSMMFSADDVLWSPDGETFAVAAGYPKFMLTLLFQHRGNAFVQVSVPDVSDGEDNPRIVPLRWLPGRRLILDISGPHAGHRIEQFYHGRATIRVVLHPTKCEKMYQRFTSKEYSH